VLTSIVNAHENSQVIDSADDCVYDIFAAEAEDFVLLFLRAKTPLAESGHRTRTRTETAGTSCIPSSELPASTEAC
jgi:hypothetical protein